MDGAAPDPAGSARVPTGSRAQASPLVDSHGSLTATGRTALSALCAAELRRRALLIDPERLLELTALRLAAFAPPDEAVSWDQAWVEECVSGSIDQARRADRERAASGAGLDGEDYDFLSPSTPTRPPAAWRLCPLDNLAFICAYEYMFRQEWDGAMRFLDPLLRHPLDALHRSYAHETLGALHMERSDLESGAKAYRDASNCGEDRPGPLAMSFALNLCLGDSRQAIDEGKRLEEMLGPDDAESAFTAEAVRYQRKHLGLPLVLAPGLDYRETALGPHTRRIVDALL